MNTEDKNRKDFKRQLNKLSFPFKQKIEGNEEFKNILYNEVILTFLFF